MPPERALPGTFRTSQAEEVGLSRRQLARLQADGAVERIGHGLYRRSDSAPIDHDLLEVAVKANRPTICLLSALAHHELTDTIPAGHDIAVPRGSWRPQVAAPVRWHQFDPATYDLGRDRTELEGYELGIYNAPRSIADTFRLRNKLGSDVAVEATRVWLRRGGKPAELLKMSKAFPVARSALLHTLQVLL